MSMRLTVIGCGTAAPDAERASAGFLIEDGSARILMDCGPGVVHGLARWHTAWTRITHLALTHFHNDHIGDVPALFFGWKYGTRPARTAPLDLVGPSGTRALMDALPDPLGAHIRDPGFEVRFRDITAVPVVTLENGVLHAFPTQHTEESVAYRLDAGDTSIGYTGDTGPDESLGSFMGGVDLLIAECSIPDAEAFPAHMTPSSVAALAVAARPEVLLITHVYPQLDRGTLPDLVAAAGWHGRTVIAHDGLTFDF
jgi:ribonuclease BN (tRNA processing enzyme)